MVDEAHHVAEDGQLAELLDILSASRQFGVTATPWRGDRFDIRHRFGEPSLTLGIEDGMRLGYLSEVRYRLYADSIDWDFVRSASEHSYSIKDLNARLFLPERDEAVREQLMAVWERTPQPRAIVFCRTVEHAEQMAALLGEVPQWRGALAVHMRPGPAGTAGAADALPQRADTDPHSCRHPQRRSRCSGRQHPLLRASHAQP